MGRMSLSHVSGVCALTNAAFMMISSGISSLLIGIFLSLSLLSATGKDVSPLPCRAGAALACQPHWLHPGKFAIMDKLQANR
jgi:hypothetical protein